MVQGKASNIIIIQGSQDVPPKVTLLLFDVISEAQSEPEDLGDDTL